jgi:hypothetical protein
MRSRNFHRPRLGVLAIFHASFLLPVDRIGQHIDNDEGARPMTHDADQVAVNLIRRDVAIMSEEISDRG